ncbi:MAG: cytochrome c oxidase subunit I [Pseudomonadota bacterium]
MADRPAADTEVQRRRRARWTLALIFTVSAAPFVLGTLAYYFFPTAARTNYGDLIEPRAVPDVPLTAPGGARATLADLKGKWVMLQFDEARCVEACERKLYYMRQARLAQGKDMGRIERVWVVLDGGVPEAPAALVEGIYIARSAGRVFVEHFPAPTDVRDHIYLIDPLGNLMLRFPSDPDPKRVIKDLQRLLRVSRIG